MAVDSGEEFQDPQNVSMLSDGGSNILGWKWQNFSEAPCLNRTQTSYDAPSKCQNLLYVKVDDLDIHTLSNMDLDIEKGKLEIPEANDEAFGVLKSEDSLTRTLQREIRLHVGGRFMKLLMNNGLELPKFLSRDKSMTERVFDTPTCRSRKYKRSGSFNSRRVVLLFSVLSSMGTVILIFLTLRLRQIGEASANA